jgi:hypothetical protein
MNAAYPVTIARPAADLVAQQFAAGRSVTFTVTTESMVPFLQPGDIITVVPLAAPPRLGDILVLGGSARPWVHRLVRTRAAAGATLLVTKGDNLARCDAAVAPARVLGRVAVVQREGLRQGQRPRRRLDLCRRPTAQAAALLAVLSYGSYRVIRLDRPALRAAARGLLRLAMAAVTALVWFAAATRASAPAGAHPKA